MDWTNILEGTIGSLIATVISALIVVIFRWMFKRKNVPQREVYLDPFYICLFLTSFLTVLTFFSMVYNWQIFNMAYLLIAAIGLGVVTYLIYHNQCPRCKGIFSKRLTKKKTMHEEKRPYHYRECTIYLYTNGEVKDKKYGKERMRMEIWRTEKEFYTCENCDHSWNRIFERNLDINSRPEPNVVQTRFKAPSPFDE